MRAAPEHAAQQVLPRGAHTIIAPRAEQRSRIVAAQRRGTRAEEDLAERQAQRAAAARSQPVLGTAPTGEVLGGESPLPERTARLQYLAKQQAARRAAQREKQLTLKAQRDAPHVAKQERARQQFQLQQERERHAAARAVSDLPLLRQRRELLFGRDGRRGAEVIDAADTAGQAEVKDHVHLLLDMLADRLRGGGGDDVVCCQRTLCKVLENALTKGEVKYRRLKARNERLWTTLLQQCGALTFLHSAYYLHVVTIDIGVAVCRGYATLPAARKSLPCLKQQIGSSSRASLPTLESHHLPH